MRFDASYIYQLLLALMLMAGGAGTAWADQTDERLAELFDELRNSADAGEARLVERRIWRIWLESGRPDVDELMFKGVKAMNRRDMNRAYTLFDRVVGIAPDYAEGWNKRATVLYLQDKLAQSMGDIEHTLRLEPRHFGALSGMGLIFSEVEDDEGALRAFEAVLEINPHSSTAAESVDELRVKVEGKAL
jgi:tetratricopeptide (TPR) repeat protein